jgi:hypothetical protein
VLAWLGGLVVLRQLAVLLFHFVSEREGRRGPGFLSRFLSPFSFGWVFWGRTQVELSVIGGGVDEDGWGMFSLSSTNTSVMMVFDGVVRSVMLMAGVHKLFNSHKIRQNS